MNRSRRGEAARRLGLRVERMTLWLLWARGWDLVVTPKTGGPAFPPPHDDLRSDFLSLMERSAHGDK